MKNLMDTYLEFTEKRIKRYMKFVYAQYYDEETVNEYIKTYINARYYNIQNTNQPARAFYLRIIDELELKRNMLLDKDKENNKIINNLKAVFEYILFFDDVRKVENFKTIDNIKQIIRKMFNTVQTEYPIKYTDEHINKLYEQIKSDLLDKEIFLEKFEDDKFGIEFESIEDENIYFAKLTHNIKMPMQYSDSAIKKVFTEGIVAEDKLQVEYVILSLISLRDIINGNFKDVYIAEFEPSLFEKTTKLNGIMSILKNQALQDKIYLKLDYSDYVKNKKIVYKYINDGFNFSIQLDNAIEDIEDVENLKIFKKVIVPKRLAIYQQLKTHKEIKNIIYK